MDKEKVLGVFDKLKEIWKNKRYQALIKIVLYVLLISFLFIVFDITDNTKISNASDNQKDEEIIENSFMTNYEATYYLNEEEIITGINKNGKEEFKINDHIYYIENEVIYSESDTKEFLEKLEDYNLLKLNSNNLSDAISFSTKVSSTNDLENNVMINNYKMHFTDLKKYFDISTKEEGQIYIIEKIKDSIVIEIQIDLSNYYEKDYIIKIEYEEVE